MQRPLTIPVLIPGATDQQQQQQEEEPQRQQSMGWSEMEARCRNHPSHRQSKGVCPSCLREKLSHLSTASSSTTTNASSTPTSLFDTAPSSSMGSPRKKGKQTAGTTMMSLLTEGKPEEPLTKSRSLAFVVTAEEGGKEKRKGFWSRLLAGKERKRKGTEKEKEKKDVVLHSKTVKERSSASWAL